MRDWLASHMRREGWEWMWYAESSGESRGCYQSRPLMSTFLVEF